VGRLLTATCQCGRVYTINWTHPKPCPECERKIKDGPDSPAASHGNFYERSSASRGWRVIGGVRRYFINRMEADYFRYLSWLKGKGLIREFEHQPKREFDFMKFGVRRGPSSFYRADFRVEQVKAGEYYVEVKGYMDPKSKTKLKRMSKYYSDVRVDVVVVKDMIDIEASAGMLIKGWEGKYGGRTRHR